MPESGWGADGRWAAYIHSTGAGLCAVTWYGKEDGLLSEGKPYGPALRTARLPPC